MPVVPAEGFDPLERPGAAGVRGVAEKRRAQPVSVAPERRAGRPPPDLGTGGIGLVGSGEVQNSLAEDGPNTGIHGARRRGFLEEITVAESGDPVLQHFDGRRAASPSRPFRVHTALSAGKMTSWSHRCRGRSSPRPRKQLMAPWVWVLIKPGRTRNPPDRAHAVPGTGIRNRSVGPTATRRFPRLWPDRPRGMHVHGFIAGDQPRRRSRSSQSTPAALPVCVRGG